MVHFFDSFKAQFVIYSLPFKLLYTNEYSTLTNPKQK